MRNKNDHLLLLKNKQFKQNQQKILKEKRLTN